MVKGLLERLRDGESIIVAEGFLFEMERRGYIKSGSFVPEVVLDHPEVLRGLHEEFAHAGSDVVLAYTYYAHRHKMRMIEREDELEKMNREALRIAREVADKTETLMAGNICNTTVYQNGNEEAMAAAKAMFKEQIEWAVEGGADFIVGETFLEYGEAALALEAIKEYGKGLPAVIMVAANTTDKLVDGVGVAEACKKLEDDGAAIVGLNCFRGPGTIMDLLKEVRTVCKGPLAALPVPYRTTKEEPTFFAINVPGTEKRAFPLELQTCLCTREDIAKFAKEAKALGTQYVGLCCGNAPHYLRIVAEVYGKHPEASNYSPEMHKHFVFGSEEIITDHYTKTVKSLITGKA